MGTTAMFGPDVVVLGELPGDAIDMAAARVGCRVVRSQGGAAALAAVGAATSGQRGAGVLIIDAGLDGGESIERLVALACDSDPEARVMLVRTAACGEITGFANCDQVYVVDSAEPAALASVLEVMLRERRTAIAARRRIEELDRGLRERGAELSIAVSTLEAETGRRSEFFAAITHEIRTPMTAILGFADLLAEADTSEAAKAEHIETIRRNGQHLLMLINDILDMAKIDAGKMTIERVAFSPSEIAADVVAALSPRAHAKGLELRMHLGDGVPRQVISDPTRVRQVLLNLVSNAVKFTEAGSITVRIGVRGARLEFGVDDTGIGMSEADLARLFKPFTQADESITRRFGGTGLGLSISHRLSVLLGGALTATSTPGEGSKFLLSLPLQAAPWNEADRAASGPASAGGTNAMRALSGRRILLAEDGIDNQRLIRLLLERAGASVTVVGNGQEAINAAEEALRSAWSFDLILMDMQMPVVDGCAATAALRARGCSSPIVALTASTMARDREKARHAGCDDFASKPIERAAFIALCARHCTRVAEIRRCA